MTHKIFLSIIITLALSSAPLQAGKIKCWTNSDNIRECGNIVPPEYAQKGHDEINAQGILTKHHKRALSKEEIVTQKRLDAEKKAAQRAIETQQRKDMVLLNTFANEDEIIMTRNGKITTIRTEVRLTNKSMDKAKQHLNKLRKRAAHNERSGKPASKNLTADIQQAQKQIVSYAKFITVKKGELNKINSQFENDMKRYKELRRPQQLSPNLR